MRYKLIKEQQLSCDIHTAWDFFSSPANLESITPVEMKFKVRSDVSESIKEGMLIDYKISPLFNIPMSWRTRITYVDHENAFTDFQEKGPYKFWEHHHMFIKNSDGVLMIDTLHYELPFGMFGDLVHKLLVKKKIEDLFSYRYNVLERMFN